VPKLRAGAASSYPEPGIGFKLAPYTSDRFGKCAFLFSGSASDDVFFWCESEPACRVATRIFRNL
jgi:hypothetical protein